MLETRKFWKPPLRFQTKNQILSETTKQSCFSLLPRDALEPEAIPW